MADKTVQDAVKAVVDNSEADKKQEDFVRRSTIVREALDVLCKEHKVVLAAEMRGWPTAIIPVPIFQDNADGKLTEEKTV